MASRPLKKKVQLQGKKRRTGIRPSNGAPRKPAQEIDPPAERNIDR
jgi:hypothetical protein